MATKKERKLDELVKEATDLDALGVIIITSAGVAGLCGVKGPLTTMMSGLTGMFGSGSIVKDLSSNNIDPMTILWDAATEPFAAASVVVEGWTLLYNAITQSNGNGTASQAISTINASPLTSAQKIALIRIFGNASSNMVEAGLMYTLFRNPDTMKALMDITKEAATGAIGLVKTGAGLLAKI